MNISRRQLLKSTAAVGATAMAGTSAQAADPYAPAEAGLPGKLFDKGGQHLLPFWAFEESLANPPTPIPTKTGSHAELIKNQDVSPFGDDKGIGKVLHGIAMEWNGDLIGGNTSNDGNGKPSSWATMKERVMPEDRSEYAVGGIPDNPDGKIRSNWEAHGQVRCYKVIMKEKLLKLRKDADHPALLYSYADLIPGPTFRFRHGIPCVVRFENLLQTETSIHHHGGHTPSHSDGFPSFYVLQNEARDYLYPNILPLHLNAAGKAVLDYGEGQSTTWYHDHGLDATAFNVSHGLAGFALWFDDLELDLIRKGVLPGFGLVRVKDDQGKWTIEQESLSGFDPDLASEKNLLEKGWKKWKKKSPNSYWSVRHKLALENKPDPEEAPESDNKNFYRRATVPYFNPYDVPIALQDRIIDLKTGQIVYDSDGHNGYIGDTQLLNGIAWPVLRVKL